MKTSLRLPLLLSVIALACSSGQAGNEASGGSSNTTSGGTAGQVNTVNTSAAGSTAGTPAGGNAGSATVQAGAGGAAAGEGGSAGEAQGGQAGSAGNSAGGTASELSEPSLGCGTAPDITPGDYVQSQLAGRSIWVRLPDNYDENRAYPVIFLWKGCGGQGQLSILHYENLAGSDAILVHGDIAPGMDCYDTADGAQFVDLPFFDAFYEHLTTSYCIDQAHAYSVGFSSGAWLTFFLGCQRGDLLRGIGTIAGGFKPTFFLDQTACTGQTAAFFISDLSDTNNPFHDLDDDGDSVEIGLNQWLTQNGCTETVWTEQAGTAVGPDENVCRAYAGCGNNPVQLCLTDGKGHVDQADISIPGFWSFFQDLLPK